MKTSLEHILALSQLDIATADAGPTAISGFALGLAHSNCPPQKALVTFSWLLRNPERLTEIISERDAEQVAAAIKAGVLK